MAFYIAKTLAMSFGNFTIKKEQRNLKKSMVLPKKVG